MKPHTRLYLRFFNYGEHQDVQIPCEVGGCCRNCQDIHHLSARGMGGSKHKDYIENLMGLCRDHHAIAEDNKEFNEHLKKVHLEFIEENRPDYEIQQP